MAYEIIYECNSLNNKNVRQGELNILEKHEAQLYFEFGSDEMNKKKRFYVDVETLNKDFNNLLKLKEKEEEEIKVEEVKKYETDIESDIRDDAVIEKNVKKTTKQSQKKNEKDVEKDIPKADSKIDKYKIVKRKK